MAVSKISNLNPTVQELSTGAVLFRTGSMRILSLNNCSTAPTIPLGDRPKTNTGGAGIVMDTNFTHCCLGHMLVLSNGNVNLYKISSYNTGYGVYILDTGDALSGTVSWSV